MLIFGCTHGFGFIVPTVRFHCTYLFKGSVYGLKPKKKLSDLKKIHVMILKPSNSKTENIGASDSASENQKNNLIIHESYSQFRHISLIIGHK